MEQHFAVLARLDIDSAALLFGMVNVAIGGKVATPLS